MVLRPLRWISLCLLPVMMISCLSGSCRAVSTSATAAVLMDADSGRVLYARNENQQMLIASTTKIMTALVAIEQGDLNQTVTVSRNAALTEGSSMYLKEGEQLTLETLLYGLLLCSGNDAAVAVADGVCGSVEAFVEQMNLRAKELGMENSSFANPNGLDAEGHYSTALDMAKLACAALDNETLMRIASTKTITIGGRTMTNHNKLLSYMDGCLGLKTGYTMAAGRTLVSCAEQNGQRLVAVTLQDGNDWADHQALYSYGFSAYPAKRAVAMGEEVGSLPVSGGAQATVPLIAAESFSWPVGQEEALTTKVEALEQVEAPVSAGTEAGELVILLDGEEVGRVKLLCGASVAPELPEPVSLLDRFRNLWKN